LTNSINRYAEYYPENVLPSLRTIHQIDAGISDVRRFEQQHILSEDDKVKKELVGQIAKARSDIRQRFKDYELLAADDEDRGLLKTVREGADPTQGTAARELNGAARAIFLPLRQNVGKWWDYNEKLAGATTDAARAAYTRVLWTFAIASAAALIIGLLAALAITRSITGPVQRASEAVKAVAAGDLTQRLQSSSRDELGQLLTMLDEMTLNLARMVAGVRLGCDQLNVAAAEIAQGNADLSSRTESQASSLEETAASVEQMAAQIKANADNARQADQLANRASEVAGAGGVAVGEVVTTMDEISASSRKIGAGRRAGPWLRRRRRRGALAGPAQRRGRQGD
jgi:methyl-accepting chemotaxis protein